MKTLALSVLGLAIAFPAFGKVVLTKKTGVLAHKGTVVVCELHDSHRGLKGIDVAALAAAAEKDALVVTRTYVRANTPSVEILAGKTSLLVDYSNRSERVGEEAQELINLVIKLCD